MKTHRIFLIKEKVQDLFISSTSSAIFIMGYILISENTKFLFLIVAIAFLLWTLLNLIFIFISVRVFRLAKKKGAPDKGKLINYYERKVYWDPVTFHHYYIVFSYKGKNNVQCVMNQEVSEDDYYYFKEKTEMDIIKYGNDAILNLNSYSN